MSDLFRIESASLPHGTRVIGFRGTEALSRPYVFEVFLQIAGEEAHSFELDDLSGAKACLLSSRDDGRPPFAFAGIFCEADLLHEQEERAVVRAVLVPQIWRLSQTRHSRVFTQQSIPDILRAVLEDGGLRSDDYVFRLSSDYKPEEHVCQYDESNLDFISRWMEREGMYYFFEHEERGERLVITDHKSFHRELVPEPVRYFPEGGQDGTAGEHLRTFTCRKRELPSTVRIKDYDYNKPTLDVAGKAPVSPAGFGDIHLHGARLFTPDAAKRLAAIRSEAIHAQDRRFRGTGTALYLRPGNTFALVDHPRAAFETSYLAIEVEHHGNQLAGSGYLRALTALDGDEVYRVDVTAIRADVQFRPQEQTPWPRIYGTEHGVIDGEAESEYAQIDEHGRYRVRFAFDENDLGAGKASTWVRMMQPHGGGIEGWHFPLRKGTEVLFTFLGGDPDRPVIAGVVPNALTPSPVTRANHTQNVIQTGGKNRIELDDAAGEQRITVSTPYAGTRIEMGSPASGYEMAFLTDANALHKVGANAVEDIGGNMSQKVAGTAKQVVIGMFNQVVGGPLFQTFSGPVSQSVAGAAEYLWQGAVKRTKVGNDLSITIGASSKTTIGATNSNFIGVSASFKGSGDLSVTVGGSASLKLAHDFSLSVGLRLSMKAGLDININGAPEIRLKTVYVEKANTALKTFSEQIFVGGLFMVG